MCQCPLRPAGFEAGFFGRLGLPEFPAIWVQGYSPGKPGSNEANEPSLDRPLPPLETMRDIVPGRPEKPIDGRRNVRRIGMMDAP